MDPREKNQRAQQKQQKRAAKRQQKAAIMQQVAQATPEQLRLKLSKRNEDYLFKLRKALIDNGQDSIKAQEKVDELLQEVIDNQIKGIPARQLYGTVATKMKVILHKKEVDDSKIDFWKLCVDNSLLLGAMFFALYGIVGFFNKHPNAQNQTRLIPAIAIAVCWGILFAWFTQKMQVDKKQRDSIWKIIAVMFLGIILTYGISMLLTAFIPTAIDPYVSPIVYLVLAAIAYGIRWLFRRYYHITINTFAGR